MSDFGEWLGIGDVESIAILRWSTGHEMRLGSLRAVPSSAAL